jgi:fido (protein-threonine AMPylation protein)
VSDEASKDAERRKREKREADLVSVRAKELYEKPIQGNFDAAHLKAVHAYLFQDLPEHRPGVIRERTEQAWVKQGFKRFDLTDCPFVCSPEFLKKGAERTAMTCVCYI